MNIKLSHGSDGIKIEIEDSYETKNKGSKRPFKGKSLLEMPDCYTIIDLETTGLSTECDSIIEVSAIRVVKGEIVDSYSHLVQPPLIYDCYKSKYCYVTSFITELTGITNEMLEDQPVIEEVLPEYLEFIGKDTIVGHNVNFDINFIYDNALEKLGVSFSNDFVDTLRVSRRLLPELPSHRLCSVAEALGVTQNDAHRALADCITTNDCFIKLKAIAIEKHGSIAAFSEDSKRTSYCYDMRVIKSEKTEFDTSHPLYGKKCVFTGVLERMTRRQAAQIVVDFGGICENDVTKNTNFLILGNNDYCTSIKDGKSNKHKKAEAYKLKGMDIEIIPENVFYDMLEE